MVNGTEPVLSLNMEEENELLHINLMKPERFD